MSVSPTDGVSATYVQPAIYRRSTTPDSGRVGDLWVDTSYSPPRLKECTSAGPPPTWTDISGSIIRTNTTAYSATLSLDGSLYDIYDVTLTGNLQLGFTNGTDGKIVRVRALQDATGNRLITFDSSIRVGTDIPTFTATTTGSKLDYLAFQYNGSAGKWDFISYVKGF